ncbi:MAG: tyrosine-type recombinase/integrase, partial [Minisyncoccales bacterium]
TAKAVNKKSTHYLYFLAIIGLLNIKYRDFFYTNPKTIKKLMKWFGDYLKEYELLKLVERAKYIAKNTAGISLNILKQKRKTKKAGIYLILRYQLSDICELKKNQWMEFVKEAKLNSPKRVKHLNLKILHNSLWEIGVLDEPYSKSFYSKEKENKYMFSIAADDFQYVFNLFLETMNIDRSKTTLRIYFNALKTFYKFLLKKHGKDFKLNDLKRSDIIDYVAEINSAKKENGESYSRSWKENKIYKVKRFIQFLMDHKSKLNKKNIFPGNFDVNFDEDFFVSIKPQRLPRKLKDEEIEMFLEGLNEIDNRLYRLSFMLMFQTGLAKIDLINLKYNCLINKGDNYFLKYYRVKVGSYKKKRIREKAAEIIKKLQRLNTQRRKTKHPDGSKCRFLLTEGGTPQNKRWFDYWFNKHIKLAKSYSDDGKMDEITPHRIRHTFASMLRDEGFDIFEIKKLLDHVNIETTKNYTKESDENKMKLVEKLESRLDKKLKKIKNASGDKASNTQIVFENYFPEGKCNIEDTDNCPHAYKCIECEYIYRTPHEIPEIEKYIDSLKKSLAKYKIKLENSKKAEKKDKIKIEVERTKHRLKILNNSLDMLKKVDNKRGA